MSLIYERGMDLTVNRRDLIRALPAIPLTVFTLRGKEVHAAKLEANAKYVVVIDPTKTDLEVLSRTVLPKDHPLIGAPIVCVYPNENQSVADVFAIYKLEESESNPGHESSGLNFQNVQCPSDEDA